MMRRFVWFFVGVFIAVAPMFAFADYWYPAGGTITYGLAGHSRSSPQAVCDYVSGTAGIIGQTQYNLCKNASGQVVGNMVSSGGLCNPINGLTVVGSATYDASYPGQDVPGKVKWCRYTGTPSCPPGQTFNVGTGGCEVPPPPPCQAGSEYSSGYYDYGLQPDSKMVYYACANGCEVTFSGESPAGRQLVDGVYHYFARGSYDRTGEACTSGPSVTGSVPAIPTATCGAGQGSATMNGKTVCVDESTGTETNPYAPKPTPETTENKTTTTNPDGSTTTITETCTGDNACTTTTQTCTVAGACTSTTTNSGGGAGGGSGTGSGTGKDADGDGTPDYDSEGNPVDPQKDDADQCQKTPNAAMCQEKVKIDPEDSPTEADYTDQDTAHDDAWAQIKANVEGRSWEWTSLGFVWNPQIPQGACSAVTVFGYSIDTCYALEKARALWAWVIGVISGLAIWITGTRAISGAKL